MTVRLEKSTLFPERFPRKRPVFPFSRCTNPLVAFLGWKGEEEEEEGERERERERGGEETDYCSCCMVKGTYCHGLGNAGHFAVDVECAVQLQEIPTFL